MDWRHKAVCRDEDPELFFPVGNSGPALAQIADANRMVDLRDFQNLCSRSRANAVNVSQRDNDSLVAG